MTFTDVAVRVLAMAAYLFLIAWALDLLPWQRRR